MSELPFGRPFWIGAAAILVIVAAGALITILTDPYTSRDTHIFYTLPAAFLAASTLFSGVALVERGSVVLGWTAAALGIFGFVLLVQAIWETGLSGSSDTFWVGFITIVTALIGASARLLARSPAAIGLALAAGATAVLAGVVSLDAALRHQQFWRVGTMITTLWILSLLLAFLVPVLERAITASDAWLVAGAALVTASSVGVVAVISGDFSQDGYSIFFTVVAAALAAPTFVAGLTLLERERSSLAWAALVVAPLGLAMIVDGIWHDTDDRFSWIWTGSLLLSAALLAVSARLVAETGVPARFANAAGVAAAAAATVSIVQIWGDQPRLTLQRTGTAIWILALLGFLLVPVVSRLDTGELQAVGAEP